MQKSLKTKARKMFASERGDVPGWVLITLVNGA
jgi:hypothetical protein